MFTRIKKILLLISTKSQQNSLENIVEINTEFLLFAHHFHSILEEIFAVWENFDESSLILTHCFSVLFYYTEVQI
jgi:hypothetical protein